MNFSYQIFEPQRAIVTRYTGTFTLTDLARSSEMLWSDPRYSRDYDGIADLSDQRASVSLTDLRSFFEFVMQRPALSSGRWAVVATTPFATACCFLYRNALGGRHPVEVFSTWEGAVSSLNLSLPTPLPLIKGFPPAA